MRTKKRGLSLFITLCLIVGMLPQTAFATQGAQDSGVTIGAGGLCEHHTAHDETCGYVEAAEGTPCTHEHSEDCYEITESCTHTHTADCYPVLDSGVSGNEATPSDAAQPTCGHACSEESGCITEKLNCTHTHDDLCGYIAAVEGQDCHYECVECTEEPETATTQVCTCEAAEDQAHAEDCALYEAPADSTCTCGAAEGEAHAEDCALYEASADPICTCETKCAEDAINTDCAICSTEGADLSACTGQEAYAAPVCDCGTDDVLIHATTCGAYVAPENPVCYCAEKCTEVNIWCDICGFDISKCSGADTAALYETTYTLADDGTLTITGTGAMGDWSFSKLAPWYGSRTSITNVVIENGVTSIGAYAFFKCSSLTSVTIPDSVTSIGSSAFYGCSSLTSVTIPDSVTSIGKSAFYGCTDLTSVTIPDSVESIGDYAFENCSSLTSVTIPDSVESIGDYTFGDCTGLTSVTIPDSVKSIGDYAFLKCSSLTSVTIPDSVTSIGSSAFENCSSLTSVTIPDSVESIGDYAFENCSSLTSVTIPDSVESIGDYTFGDCTGLTSVTIPDSVKSIGDYAFLKCSSLTSVDIPDSVKSIGKSVFGDCTGLESVTIGDSVTSIGSWAFNGCIRLASMDIPDSVTSIGDYAFYGCSSLTSVDIPDSVTSIGGSAFFKCSSLESVTIGDSVTSIGDYAFFKCSSLESVTIGDSVTSIGEYAFGDCSSLMRVTAPCKCTVEEQEVSVGETSLYTFGEGVTISIETHTALDDTGSCICGYNPIKSVIVTGDKPSWNYAPDATAKLTAEVEPASLIDATYAWKKDNEVVSGATGNTLALTNLDAGEYTYACTVTVDGYWKISEPFTVTVNGIDPTYNSPTATTNLTYNGRERALVTAGTVMVGGTMKYSTTENGPYTETIPTGISAGDHTVYYMVEGDEPNYNDIAPQPVTVTIAPASPTIAWAANATENAEYTGAAASITPPTVTLVNNESYSGTINYSYTGTSSGSGLPINAGTYTVTASIEAQGNYTGATSTNTLTLTISPKPVTIEGGNTGTTSGGGTSYGNDNNDSYTAPIYRNHKEDFADVQASLKHVDLNTGGGPLEVEAPAIVSIITTPDGKPEITDPHRGLADTTEDAKKDSEKDIPGVVEPEVVTPAPDDATESQSKSGGLFAGIALLLAALAVGGGYLYFRKRKEAES